MKAAAKIGNSKVVADSGDDIISKMDKQHKAGNINDRDDDECRATLYEDGIP